MCHMTQETMKRGKIRRDEIMIHEIRKVWCMRVCVCVTNGVI